MTCNESFVTKKSKTYFFRKVDKHLTIVHHRYNIYDGLITVHYQLTISFVTRIAELLEKFCCVKRVRCNFNVKFLNGLCVCMFTFKLLIKTTFDSDMSLDKD